jgi:hypothetical protein
MILNASFLSSQGQFRFIHILLLLFRRRRERREQQRRSEHGPLGDQRLGEEAQEVRDHGGAAQHAGGPGLSRFVVLAVVLFHLVFTIGGIVVVVCAVVFVVIVVVVNDVVVLDVFAVGGDDGR